MTSSVGMHVAEVPSPLVLAAGFLLRIQLMSQAAGW